MGIIERDLFKDITGTLFVVLSILTMVFAVSVLLHVLKYVAAGLLGPDVLLPMIGYKLLGKSGLIIPPIFFFAVLWVVSRMYRDNEITALHAAGYSQLRLHVVIFLLGLPFALFVAWMMTSVLPWAKFNDNVLRLEGQRRVDVNNLKPRQFHTVGDTGVVLFAGAQATGERGLVDVFVQDSQLGKLGLVRAQRAYQVTDGTSGERHIVFVKGRRYQGEPGEPGYAIGEFDEYIMRVPMPDSGAFERRRSARPSLELIRSADIADRAEFHARLSSVIAVSVFGVLGVALARSGPRSDIYGRMALAVAIYFSYVNLQQVALAWMRKGITPEWLGVWWVSLIMLLISALIILSDSHWLNRRINAWRVGRP